VVHEIDVHVTRGENGLGQALQCFSTGVPGSLITEEGLAMVSEERAGVSAPGMLSRQTEVVRAIHLSRDLGFKDLYDELSLRVGAGLAWGVCLRIKRGLKNPEKPGVYAKDSVYLKGRMVVQSWLESGGDIAHLYVGKVGINDPIEDWLAQGWVKPSAVPKAWRSN